MQQDLVLQVNMMSTDHGKQNASLRLLLYSIFKSKDLKIKNCDIFKFIKKTNPTPIFPKKDSASNTIISIAGIDYTVLLPHVYITRSVEKSSIAPPNVFFKISFASKYLDIDNSLEVEEYIYKNVINDIIIKKYTPNVMAYLGSFTCVNFLQYINSFSQINLTMFIKEILKQATAAELHNKQVDVRAYYRQMGIPIPMNENNVPLFPTMDTIYDLNVANVLMLELGKGDDLTNLVKKNKIDIEEFRSILFQMLYTLLVFGYIGLQHNDLHTGNVWVDDADNFDIFYITDDDTFYQVPTNNRFVKLYDFDFGSYKGRKNTFLEYYGTCKKNGACNRYINEYDKYDTFTVLCALHMSLIQYDTKNKFSAITKFIERHISKDLLNTDFAHGCRMDAKTMFGYIPVTGPTYMPKDTVMSPISDMLEDEFFDQYRYDRKVVSVPRNYEHVYSLPK